MKCEFSLGELYAIGGAIAEVIQDYKKLIRGVSSLDEVDILKRMLHEKQELHNKVRQYCKDAQIGCGRDL